MLGNATVTCSVGKMFACQHVTERTSKAHQPWSQKLVIKPKTGKFRNPIPVTKSPSSLLTRQVHSKIGTTAASKGPIWVYRRYPLSVSLLSKQWLKWFCEAGGGGSPDEARLEQTPYPCQPTNLALFRHKITLYRFNQGGGLILLQGGSNGSRGAEPPLTLTTVSKSRRPSSAGESPQCENIIKQISYPLVHYNRDRCVHRRED